MEEEFPVCLPPDRDARQPRFVAPRGTVDCHTHVFESKYTLTEPRDYTPPDSTIEDLRRLHQRLGVDRVVLTQPSVYGVDNSAILDAMDDLGDSARCVVAVNQYITDQALQELDRNGVKGVRLNLDNIGGMPIELSELSVLAKRIADLGWHFEFLFHGSAIIELAPMIKSLSVPVSIGHFGYMSATEGTKSAAFKTLLSLVESGDVWVKLSAPNRLGVGDEAPWPEVIPLARHLIAANPDRLLWGTDWPHPNKFVAQPNDADLIEQIEHWAPDKETQHKILVDNPTKLYHF